jgi:hypothetical protein
MDHLLLKGFKSISRLPVLGVVNTRYTGLVHPGTAAYRACREHSLDIDFQAMEGFTYGKPCTTPLIGFKIESTGFIYVNDTIYADEVRRYMGMIKAIGKGQIDQDTLTLILNLVKD